LKALLKKILEQGSSLSSSKHIGKGRKELVAYLFETAHDGIKDGDMTSQHVDHIFPIKAYDIHDEKQRQNVTHFSNLQLLTGKENTSKHAKFPTKAMAAKVDRDKWPPGITEDMLPDIYPGWATPLRM
jgi:5-methylcytosine-specific restriction endonuclease McrA